MALTRGRAMFRGASMEGVGSCVIRVDDVPLLEKAWYKTYPNGPRLNLVYHHSGAVLIHFHESKQMQGTEYVEHLRNAVALCKILCIEEVRC